MKTILLLNGFVVVVVAYILIKLLTGKIFGVYLTLNTYQSRL